MKKILVVFLFILGSNTTYSQNLKIDSLKKVLLKTEEDSNKVKLLDKLSFQLSNVDPTQGLKYANEALDLARKIKWTKGIGLAYFDLGINYTKFSKFDESLLNFELALKEFQNIRDIKCISATYSNIGLLYKSRSDYKNALDYSFKALKLDDYLDPLSKAILLENIGTIYLEQKNYDKTKEYYAQAIVVYKKLNNIAGISRNLTNTAIMLDEAKRYDEALKNHFEALEINTKIPNKNGIQISYSNIGYVYSHKKDYANALKYQNLALDLSKELNFKQYIAINYGNIGETYYYAGTDSLYSNSTQKRNHNLNLSVENLNKAIKLCKEIQFTGPQLEFTQFLSDAYFALNKHYNSLLTLKEVKKLQDSELVYQNELEIKKLESQHELDLKDKELIIKNKEVIIAQLNAENERNDKIILASLILLIVAISIRIVYKLRKRNQQQKDKLSSIAKVQAHDIRGPLASILGLINMFNTENYTDPNNAKVIEYLRKSSNDLDHVIKKIIQEASEKEELGN